MARRKPKPKPLVRVKDLIAWLQTLEPEAPVLITVPLPEKEQKYNVVQTSVPFCLTDHTDYGETFGDGGACKALHLGEYDDGWEFHIPDEEFKPSGGSQRE